jgi:hypothetical protein
MAGTGDELGHVRPDQRLENDVLEGGEVEPLQYYPVAERTVQTQLVT